MENKKLGLGSISLLLAIIAIVWAFEINGFCVGDSVLATIGIPTWSNSASASGIHYTVFYSLLFLLPAFIIGLKKKEDLFANVGKWISGALIAVFIIAPFFMTI